MEGFSTPDKRADRVDLVTELNPLDTLRVAESPFAKVVKNRSGLGAVYGLFNMRKTGSPWRDVRLRQAVNVAIHRDDLIRYATRGNGVIVPALIGSNAFGYDPDLAPYPFDPVKAPALLREAGYPDGLAVTLIAPLNLEVQATVVGKMLEQVGFTGERQILEPAVYSQKTQLLYSPIQLYAVNKAVEFVPHANGLLTLGETGVTDEHWSVRQGTAQ